MGGRPMNAIQGDTSYFGKVIANYRAVGAGSFARHHGSRLSANCIFPLIRPPALCRPMPRSPDATRILSRTLNLLMLICIQQKEFWKNIDRPDANLFAVATRCNWVMESSQS